MEDQLRFTTQRRGNHVADICVGFDRAGHPVEFEVDTRRFLANSERQFKWATRAEAANDIFQAFIAIGVTPDRAWELTEPALPDDMFLGTAWDGSESVGQRVADGDDERLERLHDVGGQSRDGDH